jgi:hypothetical protein
VNTLRTLPAVFSLSLLGAHYVRSGQTAVVALCLIAAGFAFLRRPWAVWTCRLALVAGAGVWAGTLVAIASRRQAVGESWGRMAVILGLVCFLTIVSAIALPGAESKPRPGDEGGGNAGIAGGAQTGGRGD